MRWKECKKKEEKRNKIRMVCFHGTSLLPVWKELLSPAYSKALYSFHNVCRTRQIVTKAEYKKLQILESSR